MCCIINNHFSDKPIEIVGVKVQLYGSSSGTFYAYFRLGSSNLAYEAQDGKWDKRINVELSDLQLSDQEYTFWMDNNFTCPANSVCGIYLASDTLNIRYYNGATLGIVPGEVSLTAGWGRAGLFTGISGYPRFL
jgi:hypothetical protein